jgi:hypothetical protein
MMVDTKAKMIVTQREIAFSVAKMKKEKCDAVFRQPYGDNIEDVTRIQSLQNICQNANNLYQR